MDTKMMKLAREEGRLCRICHEPISKEVWNNKYYRHLCYSCFVREMNIEDRIASDYYKELERRQS